MRRRAADLDQAAIQRADADEPAERIKDGAKSMLVGDGFQRELRICPAGATTGAAIENENELSELDRRFDLKFLQDS